MPEMTITNLRYKVANTSSSDDSLAEPAPTAQAGGAGSARSGLAPPDYSDDGL